MSTPDQQQRNAAMHAHMAQSLNQLKAKTLGDMNQIAERVKKRPQLNGDDTFKKISADNSLTNDNSGEIIMSAAIGAPGLSETADSMMDVGEQLKNDHDSQKAAMRPQDKQEYSFGETAKILRENKQDFGLYMKLKDDLLLYTTYLDMGYTHGAYTKGGSFEALMNPEKPEFAMGEEPSSDRDRYDFRHLAFEPQAFKPPWAA